MLSVSTCTYFFAQIYDDTRKPKNGIDWKWCSESAPNEGHQQEIHSSPFGQRFPRNAKRRRIGMLFRTFRSVVDHIGNHHLWNSAWCRLDVHRCIVVLLFLVLLLLSSTITFFHAWKIIFLWPDSIVIWYLFNFFFLFGNVKRLSIRPTFYLPLPKIILVLSSSSYRFLRIKCGLTKKTHVMKMSSFQSKEERR